MERQQGAEGEGEDEMPLLFLEGLPSDFRHNAQLAAIASFMAGSDDEDDACADAPEEQQRAGKSRRGQKHSDKSSRERRRQKPYSRPARGGAEVEATKGVPQMERKRQEAESTKELQLYLSLFHV